jgi:hypothetical protein
MGILDLFRRYFRRPVAQPVMVRAMPKGRTSVDSVDNFPTNSWIVVPPSSYEQNWQLLNLSSKDFDQVDPARLLEMLADLSPEVSRALWDFLRMCNPGFEVEVKRPGSDVQDKRGQAAVEAFIDSLSDQYGTFDIVIGRLFTGAFLRGALCAELVLDKRGRMPLDLATPDPVSVRFRRRSDPERGDLWQPGQWQAHEFKPLDIPTFRYVPIDPLPNSPYGRPLAAPALFTSLFLLGILHDLRRVIQQQGYPRIDIDIDIAQLLEAAPHLAANTTEFNNFVSDLVTQVESAYSQLQPDDAYIHTSNVSVNRPVGAVDSSSLGGIDAIIKALERMAVRALKTMPLMLGITETTGDVQSNRQFEIFAAGIKSIQHYAETMLGRLFTLALEAQGIQANVTFTFAELRAAEELRDAQTETMRIANAKTKRDEGWQTQDESSIEITGTPAVAPAPIAQAPNPEIVQDDGDGQEQANNDEQAARDVWITELRQGRAIVTEALEAINLNGFHEKSY